MFYIIDVFHWGNPNPEKSPPFTPYTFTCYKITNKHTTMKLLKIVKVTVVNFAVGIFYCTCVNYFYVSSPVY